MQLILHFNCRRPLLNEFPNYLHLLASTSFKALRVMKNKVASRVCNLVFNVMYAPLNLVAYQRMEIHASMQLTSIEGVKCVKEGAGFLLSSCFMDAGSLNLCLGSLSWMPCLSYMMVLVPCATAQTFSRMVVLPELALPMTRIRKWGHSYCPWSTAIDSGSASITWVSHGKQCELGFDLPNACVPVLIIFAIMQSQYRRLPVGMAQQGWMGKSTWDKSSSARQQQCTRQQMVCWIVQGKEWCTESTDETRMVYRNQNPDGSTKGNVPAV